MRKLITQQVSRLQQYLQSQLNTIQNQVNEGLNDLNTILPKVTMYDKELRLV